MLNLLARQLKTGRDYRIQYNGGYVRTRNNVRFPETFQLDEEKREKLSKKIRKTIKLGKNISVVVKDLEQLEETDFVQGYDEEKGKNYMIVYYD